MRWLLGGLTLAAVAILTRRILQMGEAGKAAARRLASLPGALQAIYQPLAQEIEAQTAILGITLNDAFGEREAGRDEMAWHVVRLTVGEWERLTELVVGLQNVLSRFLYTSPVIVPVRRVAAGQFKSRAVVDNVKLYEFLDQILFRSKRRFALQLWLLVRASTLLRKDFKHTCREGALTLDSSEELWTRLDYYFHDFDLIAKETLLAFRTLLACQSPERVQELALDLRALLERGTRVSVSLSNQ